MGCGVFGRLLQVLLLGVEGAAVELAEKVEDAVVALARDGVASRGGGLSANRGRGLLQ